MVCVCDRDTMEQFMPFIIQDEDLLDSFKLHVQRLTCQEYQEELDHMIIRAPVTQKYKHALQQMCAGQKLTDVQWRCI